MNLHLRGFFRQKVNHGGINRSDQLSELARHAGILSIDPAKPVGIVKILARRPKYLIRNIYKLFLLQGRDLTLKGYAAMYAYLCWTSFLIDEFKLTDKSLIWIEISPEVGICIGLSFCIHKISFECFPHNIEFMVPNQKLRLFKTKPGLFKAEYDIFQFASSTTCISIFDKSVVLSLGIKKVKHLKYEPDLSKRQELAAIRRDRKIYPKTHYLIFGSASNSPSRQGMQELISDITQTSQQSHFIVAGLGTETLDPKGDLRIVILGSINNAQLGNLLRSCIAALIVPVQTSGIITRVIENELAGIHTYMIGDYIQSHEFNKTGYSYLSNLANLP
jgi:hypothetical protein